MHSGKLIIFSAPSGSGKTSIVKRLVAENLQLGFSISACTRDKRGRKEEHGKDYYFLTPEEFKKKIDNDEFVEWQEVYEGAFYGTLKSEIERIWLEGKHVIFDVDVQGGLNLKRYYKERALAIFVKVPSLKILEDRLRLRDTETKDSISKRLFKAKFEMTFEKQFDVVIVNDELDRAVEEAKDIVKKFIKS